MLSIIMITILIWALAYGKRPKTAFASMTLDMLLIMDMPVSYKQTADLLYVLIIIAMKVNANVVSNIVRNLGYYIADNIGEKSIRKDRPSGLFLFYRKERKKYD